MTDGWKALRSPLPDDWSLIVGADTGTYMNVAFVGIPPGDEAVAVILAEFPNYRYVAHEIELHGQSVPEWARWVMRGFHHLQPRRERCSAWADPNTQFKAELAHYGIDLRANHRKLELRVEITREYVQSVTPSGVSRFLVAPWLEIIPYEMEHAKWPDGTTGAGKFERLKEHDHGLDCVEHALSRRPRSKEIFRSGKKSFLQQHLDAHRMAISSGDPHLGPL
jgi:hypothetical protein